VQQLHGNLSRGHSRQGTQGGGLRPGDLAVLSHSFNHILTRLLQRDRAEG